MLGKLIDRTVKKRWSAEDIKNYVGTYRYTLLTHAIDPELRRYSASGGSTTALMIESLKTGVVDGCVVCNAVVEDGKVRSRMSIATTPEEIIAAQGSKYVETKFLAEALPLIRKFDGKLAIIALPCDISALMRWAAKDKAIGDKIGFTIGMICGHNSRTELIDHVTAKLEKEAGSKLTNYRFRFGHWRGKIEATFADGTVKTPPTRIFNDYQNLFFFSERKCLACYDHYAYEADITVGDVWLYRLKNDPIKKTAIIVRSDLGDSVMQKALADGAIHSEVISVEDVMDGQSRIGPAHYNVSARARVAKYFDFKLKDPLQRKVKWHSFLNASITLANVKLSEKPYANKVIFGMPKQLIRAYLMFKKSLETLR